MEKQIKSYIFYAGIAIFAAGLLLKALFPGADGALGSLPFALIGFGAGIIGVGLAGLWKKRLLKDHPEEAKQLEIDEHDERNIRLREKAGYATWYLTMLVLAAMTLTLLVLDYQLACFLSLVALFVHIVGFFVYIGIYNKKM